MEFLINGLYMAINAAQHPIDPDMRTAGAHLLWSPLLRIVQLIFLIIGCIGLIGCSATGQLLAGEDETFLISSPTTAVDPFGTPTLQDGASNHTTPTNQEATATATASPTVSPTASLTPTPTPLLCWELGGRFEMGELESELLLDPLSYRVYLPSCYDEQPERRYPVLYMIHGQSSNDDQWERLGVGSVVEELVAKEDFPPMIIVMPRDRVWKEPTEDNFGRSVAEELVPWIDEHYRTQPEREYRAVGGLSRGGAWALHLGLEYWELFGSIGAHSGFIFHTDTYLVNGWLDEIPFEELPRIFMDAADQDRPPILQSALWFEDLLTQRGIAHEWRIYPGYHEEDYWRAHVEDYLRWYAGEWGKEEQ